MMHIITLIVIFLAGCASVAPPPVYLCQQAIINQVFMLVCLPIAQDQLQQVPIAPPADAGRN